MSYLLERDAINGKQGKAFLTLNGVINELFGVKKIQTDYDTSITSATAVILPRPPA